MIIYLLSIPFAVLAIAVSIVPLLVGMRYETKENLQRAAGATNTAAATIESRKFELAA